MKRPSGRAFISPAMQPVAPAATNAQQNVKATNAPGASQLPGSGASIRLPAVVAKRQTAPPPPAAAVPPAVKPRLVSAGLVRLPPPPLSVATSLRPSPPLPRASAAPSAQHPAVPAVTAKRKLLLPAAAAAAAADRPESADINVMMSRKAPRLSAHSAPRNMAAISPAAAPTQQQRRQVQAEEAPAAASAIHCPPELVVGSGIEFDDLRAPAMTPPPKPLMSGREQQVAHACGGGVPAAAAAPPAAAVAAIQGIGSAADPKHDSGAVAFGRVVLQNSPRSRSATKISEPVTSTNSQQGPPPSASAEHEPAATPTQQLETIAPAAVSALTPLSPRSSISEQQLLPPKDLPPPPLLLPPTAAAATNPLSGSGTEALPSGQISEPAADFKRTKLNNNSMVIGADSAALTQAVGAAASGLPQQQQQQQQTWTQPPLPCIYQGAESKASAAAAGRSSGCGAIGLAAPTAAPAAAASVITDRGISSMEMDATADATDLSISSHTNCTAGIVAGGCISASTTAAAAETLSGAAAAAAAAEQDEYDSPFGKVSTAFLVALFE